MMNAFHIVSLPMYVCLTVNFEDASHDMCRKIFCQLRTVDNALKCVSDKLAVFARDARNNIVCRNRVFPDHRSLSEIVSLRVSVSLRHLLNK